MASGYVACFTGQGSQFAGMGKSLYEASAAARSVLDAADAALPGVKQLCFEGPEDELVKTVWTQPCMLAIDVAAWQAFGREPAAAAGHSLGEYAALVVAGSLDIATAIALVRARAAAMQEAVPEGTGGMVAVLRMTLEEARKAQAEVSAGICDLANFNAPGQYVMSGESAAMDELATRLGRRHAMKLAVSVPFHSSLLREAGERFAERLRDTDFADPAFPIVCNVDALPVTTGAEARDALIRQFAGSVLWQPSVEWLLDQGHRSFIEFGSKPTLVRMIDKIAREHGTSVTTAAVCEATDLEA